MNAPMRTSSARSPFLVSPAYDWAFFLLAPVVALLLGIAVASSTVVHTPFVMAGADTTFAGFGLGILIHAHLVAVLFRSHVNGAVFARYRVRFLVVPLVLFAALVASEWLATASLVVATFWDVYHSGAQTFGFARIYDRNAGAPGDVGRRLDFALNQLLYAGPILAGVSLAAHVDELGAFEDLHDPLAVMLTHVPARVLSHQAWITWTVLALGALFIVVYLVAYARLYRNGYPVSRLKVFLLASTGLCSIYTWAFDSWGEAFFIMNVFHGVQYLALVWALERGNIARRFFGGRARPWAWAAAFFFGSVIAYGVGVELLDASYRSLWAITMVVSLMHFWYDGFVWSVRTGDV
jgi:hypothetical protein